MPRMTHIGTHCTTVGQEEIDGQFAYNYCRYHATDVVRWTDSRIELRSGGYRTATTKCRMMQVATVHRLPYRVYQKDFDWFVIVDGFEDHQPFGNGVYIKLVNGEPVAKGNINHQMREAA